MNRACASTHVFLFQCKFPLIIMLHQVPVDPIQPLLDLCSHLTLALLVGKCRRMPTQPYTVRRTVKMRPLSE